MLYLPEITPARRKREEQFNTEHEAARPAILGALFDAVACALREHPNLNLTSLPRMADFAAWAAAAMPALGKQPTDFLEAYGANRGEANALTLEASPIAKHVQAIATVGAWAGTASALLDLINAGATDDERHRRGWPKNGKAISDALRRITVNLRSAGVFIGFNRSAGARDILIDKIREQTITKEIKE